jgi:hypothetical protein
MKPTKNRDDDDCGSAESHLSEWITFAVALVIAMYLVLLTEPLWRPFVND